MYTVAGVLAVLLTLVLGVITGNVTTLKLLNKLKISILSGNPLKDYRVHRHDVLGWIKVPNVCYAPVLSSKDRGGIYVDTPESLKKIARVSDSGKVFSDLTVINGSMMVLGTNLRNAQFTYMKRYINSDLRKYHPVIIVDGGKLRRFNFLFSVEMGIEKAQKLAFKDRDTFLTSMRSLATIDSGLPFDKDVLILRGVSDIDVLIVFLVEA